MDNKNIFEVKNTKVVYEENGELIKLFEPGYSKADILNECLNQQRVAEAGLNVPEVLEIRSIDGQWAIVSQYIAGKTLEQLLRENPDKEEEYLQFMVDLQSKMFDTYCPALNNLKVKMDRKINSLDIDATMKYDLRARLEKLAHHTKLCHGDFNPSNIIIDENGEPWLLDWSHATIGNGAADVALTYLLFCMHGFEEQAEKYLDIFCNHRSKDRLYILKWVPIVAAAQLPNCEEKDREFLLGWANEVQYQ